MSLVNIVGVLLNEDREIPSHVGAAVNKCACPDQYANAV